MKKWENNFNGLNFHIFHCLAILSGTTSHQDASKHGRPQTWTMGGTCYPLE